MPRTPDFAAPPAATPLQGNYAAKRDFALSFSKDPKSVSFSAAHGADRARTGDLLLAKQALSQLSYCPSRPSWARVDLNHRPRAYQARALTS